MADSKIYLEYFTTGGSILIVFLILYTIFSYRKKISFIKKLIDEKNNGKFTSQDKQAVEETIKKEEFLRFRITNFSKFIYPILILIAGVFFAFYDFKEALTHINIVIVAFLYLNILKINVTSYINQMKLLV